MAREKNIQKILNIFLKTKRTSVNEAVKEKIQELDKEAKSQQHFLQLLQENNLNHYERNAKPTEIFYDNIKFRFSRLDIPFQEMSVD
jgi:hypothetical protein